MITIITIVCVLWNSNSFYITVNSSIGIVLLITSILLTLLFNSIIFSQKDLLLLAILFFSPLISMFVNGAIDSFGTTTRFVLTVLAAFLMAKTETLSSIFDKFIKVLVLLTIVSLIPFVLVNFFGVSSFLQKLPVLTNVNGSSVHTAYLFNFYTYRTDRNMSIFWEPSIYSSYCGLAISFELVFRKKIRIPFIIILILGILSSRSTGGYLLLGFLLILFLNIMVTRKSKSIMIDAFLSALLLAIAVLLIVNYNNIVTRLNELNPDVFYKLISENDSSSLTTRADSASYNIGLFLNKPFFGYGLGNVDGYYVQMGGHNQTSTLTYYLASFGFLGIVYSIILVVGIFKQNIKFSTKIMLLVIVSYIILKEPYYFSCGMHLLVFVLLNYSNNGSEGFIDEENKRYCLQPIFQG